MSRMRQIPVMDVTQREKMLQQNQPPGDSGAGQQPVCSPQMYHAARPVQVNYRPRTRKLPATKFRLSDTPALISNGCNSVREFCNSVQSITVDLNNLIGSVESMVPLLNTYLAVLQSRNAVQEQCMEPPIDVTARECNPQNNAQNNAQSSTLNYSMKESYAKDDTAKEHIPKKSAAKECAMQTNQAHMQGQAMPSQPQHNTSPMSPPMPRPEDIQQLLENPLVQNLLTGFMQNSAFPNTGMAKENALNQQ